MIQNSKLKTQNSKFYKGFTLIETLIASTIFTFVAVMGIGIFFQATRVTDRLNADREISQAARFMFEQMSRSVRAATEFSIDHSGGSAALRNSPCPANFLSPKTFSGSSGTLERWCGDRFTVTGGGVTETFGALQAPGMSYTCLARVAGSSLSAASVDNCITPPTVSLVSPNPADPLEQTGFLVTGYYRSNDQLEQKPFLKIRATLEATQVTPGTNTKKSYTLETTLVARNFEKQY
ncbi:type II secretion system protein [Candidatus Berkelbacteria bacterium]|nr:type II secretion system protein [Candidatus Berkelbacteria bacterium]